ncbi:MAG: tetratricopeptide repeat protein [Phenylobacterium sp.]|uniref:tetratricopeptide repeat protein n=1 Tax=Phenylobacterium sp. TaxID=1871053 RepID=UPI0027189375|nr:tetratricopeptide repeat protein [Phenylobacterium sp.]MDO8901534.1 tetratricopeptide repeat protein [Phenylobacterium sp.]MDP2214644.1 tetratricopeptide repeat protein [Phenylobacterium sp.]
MVRGLSILAALAAIAAVPGGAHGAVTVIGGGMAEACSRAAVDGRSDRRFEEFCDIALETEFMNARDRAGTHVNRGVLRMRRAEYAPAIADFDLAVKMKPDLGEGHVNRGAALIGQRKYAESLPSIDRGLELGVEEPAKAYYNRALAHEGLEDARSAYLDYQKAQELAPEWAAPAEQLTRFSVTTRTESN